MNPLDHKPFRNTLSGKGARGKQRFKPNPLSGFGKGSDVTTKNKLAYPPGRHRLVFRAMLDGVRLIESLKKEIDDVSVMPPVKLSKGEQTPSVRPPIGLPRKRNLGEGSGIHTIEGSSNTNDGVHKNRLFVNSLMPIMRDVKKLGGDTAEFVKHLRDEYDLRYENMDPEIQRDILKTWTYVSHR
jgi:hypothetical protein